MVGMYISLPVLCALKRGPRIDQVKLQREKVSRRRHSAEGLGFQFRIKGLLSQPSLRIKEN